MNSPCFRVLPKRCDYDSNEEYETAHRLFSGWKQCGTCGVVLPCVRTMAFHCRIKGHSCLNPYAEQFVPLSALRAYCASEHVHSGPVHNRKMKRLDEYIKIYQDCREKELYALLGVLHLSSFASHR